MRYFSSSYWQSIFNRRMLICVFIGFASGMPFFVVLQMIPLWLRDLEIGLAEIGLFALTGLPYIWKFAWAPLLDRYVPLRLGRRRGWMLLTQVALFFAIGAVGLLDPREQLGAIAMLTMLIAFFSASQDVVIDGYRRELLSESEFGLGNAIHVAAYRISTLVPASLGFILADVLPWAWVFWIVAAFMAVGMVTTLWVAEPPLIHGQPRTLREAVLDPFKEFLHRDGANGGVRGALFILAFLLLYKLGDNMATALATPFYLDLGYTKTEIGLVAKHAALWPAIIGGLLGGAVMIRLGINRSLWVFGVVQLVSIFGFALLAQASHNLWLLAAVIGFEYLGVGLGTAAFMAFISRETSLRFAATQFALFTAVVSVPRTVVNASTGFLVETLGWTPFFLLCALLAVPGMLLLVKVAPWRQAPQLSRP